MRTVILGIWLLSIAGCSAHRRDGGDWEADPGAEEERIANLKRAAQLPWRDCL